MVSINAEKMVNTQKLTTNLIMKNNRNKESIEIRNKYESGFYFFAWSCAIIYSAYELHLSNNCKNIMNWWKKDINVYFDYLYVSYFLRF